MAPSLRYLNSKIAPHLEDDEMEDVAYFAEILKRLIR